MSLRIAVAVFVLTGLVSTAEAGLFRRSSKHPKPYSAVDGDKVDSAKGGQTQKHPGKVQKWGWGRNERALMRNDVHSINHSLRD